MATLEERLDAMPPSRGQLLILVICLLLNVADGFDVLAMSYAAPALTEAWSLDPRQLGAVFSAALVGMAAGSLLLAPLADVFGRRTMVLAAAAFVSAGMFGAAMSESLWQLMAVRFLAGLGIGVIIPISATLAAEYAPARIRNAGVVLVAAGFSVGAVSAGLVAEEIILAAGWPGMFVAGGVLTALLFLLALVFLKESVYFIAAGSAAADEKIRRVNQVLTSLQREHVTALPPPPVENRSRGSVLALFAPGLRFTTAQLWVLWFALNWSSYLLANWVPSLMVHAGYSPAQGIDALTWFTTGALIGAVVLGLLSARFLLAPMVAGMLVMAGALLAGWVTIDLAFVTQKIVLGVVGFMFSASYGFWAIAAANYPPRIRATGVGWSGGFGRLGAIVSPLVTGYVVAAAWELDHTMLTLLVPAVLLAAGLIYSAGRRAQPATDAG